MKGDEEILMLIREIDPEVLFAFLLLLEGGASPALFQPSTPKQPERPLVDLGPIFPE